MKSWPWVIVLGVILSVGAALVWVRGPDTSTRAPWELPRLPLERTEAPLPPRFAGPLPSRVEDFPQELEKGPPLSYVRARLLEGDREMGVKLLAALRQTAASARDLDELWETYGDVLGISGSFPPSIGDRPPYSAPPLLGFQDEGVPCSWLREWLSGPSEQPPLLTELLWRKLTRCPGAETTALFAREDAPPRWVLDHHSLFGGLHFTPALERAIRHILDLNRLELFDRAMIKLADNQEPAARELRERLWRQASDELRAEWERREAYWALEDQRKKAHPWKCPPIPTRPEGVDFPTINGCLEEWAASSWAETARFAMSAARSPELQDYAEDLGTLTHFSSVEAMKTWARERQLLPEAAPASAQDPHSLFLITYMREARRAFNVNLRMFTSHRQHDELLVTLAWVVRPALDGVVFEQIPPKTPAPQLFEPPSSDTYSLRAYADGQRFSVQARNAHSLDDIGAVLGLLNHVLEARGSLQRFAVLDTSFYQVDVVFAPEATLREADTLELWRLGDGARVHAQAEAQIEHSLGCLLGQIPC